MPTCFGPREALGDRLVFGLWANLYSVHSRRGLGVGDLGDLAELVRFAARAGADFVGVNPLHALRNAPPEVSPYQPLSRLFRNPIYLDVSALPELSECAEARALRERPRPPQGDVIDYAAVAAHKRDILRALHRSFAEQHAEGQSERGRAYRRYRAEAGALLEDFATFLALEDHLAGQGQPRDWRAWPAEYRSPRSPAVAAFRAASPREVDFHAFVQFELDRQLAGVAAEARQLGLAIGLYQDLALGSAASGFDTWAFPDLFVPGESVGAPPDEFTAAGQDWAFPPLHPERLAQGEDSFWRRLLRAGFAHAGALRIDHVLGLRRQFWIPAGAAAAEGRYVPYPAKALLSALAEESRRQRALVIGEDLGNVPRGLPAQLARYAVLSSRVLLFERERSGAFRASARYSRRALVTANTHDLPSLPAFASGRDLEVRHKAGDLDDAALAEARRRRERDLRALRQRLGRERLLAAEAGDPRALTLAVHRFLARTPAPLVGVSLDDLAGETEPVNLPGLSFERFPSWSRRMRTPLEELVQSDAALEGLAAAARPTR